MKIKFPYISIVAICAISLLALGCNKSDNSLNRPASQTESNNSNQQSAIEDNGEVAGAEVIQLPTKKIKVDNKEIEVELPNTDEAMQRGLSFREKLENDKGMLFDFTKSGIQKPGFWMKDMLFSIDIIWIDKDNTVIAVSDNVPVQSKDSNYTIYYPPSDVTHVLEVPAGWSKKNNVTVGSNISL